jgi:hypothetical protein
MLYLLFQVTLTAKQILSHFYTILLPVLTLLSEDKLNKSWLIQELIGYSATKRFKSN